MTTPNTPATGPVQERKAQIKSEIAAITHALAGFGIDWTDRINLNTARHELRQELAQLDAATHQPVTYGGVVYFDQKSADGARDNQERAEKLEAPWAAADRLGGRP